jgi:hypothetical protein
MLELMSIRLSPEDYDSLLIEAQHMRVPGSILARMLIIKGLREIKNTGNPISITLGHSNTETTEEAYSRSKAKERPTIEKV